MNGEDESSGSIKYGGTRKKGIWVPKGVRATIFVTGGKQQENTKKQEAKQTSKKKRKQRQKKKDIQKQTTEILPLIREQAKRAEQKGAEARGTNRIIGATKHKKRKRQKHQHTIVS